MKLTITRKDNDEAIDGAFKELMELMDGRLAGDLKKPESPAPEQEGLSVEGPAEEQLAGEERDEDGDEDEDGISREDVEALLEQLKG
jgi:NACalpha-BTF3-like transcription factor